MEGGQGTLGWDGGDHGARTKVTQGDGGEMGWAEMEGTKVTIGLG